MQRLLLFLRICVFEKRSHPILENNDWKSWPSIVQSALFLYAAQSWNFSHGTVVQAGSFGGTTAGYAGTGVELPCGFAQWWLNHKNMGTEGCTPQGLWDSSTFSGRTAALGKWWCRSRSEDSKALEESRSRVGRQEPEGETGGRRGPAEAAWTGDTRADLSGNNREETGASIVTEGWKMSSVCGSIYTIMWRQHKIMETYKYNGTRH